MTKHCYELAILPKRVVSHTQKYSATTPLMMWSFPATPSLGLLLMLKTFCGPTYLKPREGPWLTQGSGKAAFGAGVLRLWDERRAVTDVATSEAILAHLTSSLGNCAIIAKSTHSV